MDKNSMHRARQLISAKQIKAIKNGLYFRLFSLLIFMLTHSLPYRCGSPEPFYHIIKNDDFEAVCHLLLFFRTMGYSRGMPFALPVLRKYCRGRQTQK